jgi:hypothetical protein
MRPGRHRRCGRRASPSHAAALLVIPAGQANEAQRFIAGVTRSPVILASGTDARTAVSPIGSRPLVPVPVTFRQLRQAPGWEGETTADYRIAGLPSCVPPGHPGEVRNPSQPPRQRAPSTSSAESTGAEGQSPIVSAPSSARVGAVRSFSTFSTGSVPARRDSTRGNRPSPLPGRFTRGFVHYAASKNTKIPA